MRSGKALDIGSSYGWFLEELDRAGLTPEGVEPSKRACDEVLKYKVTCSPAESFLKKVKGRYNIVSLWNVLEHMKNPQGVLKEISRLQKENDKIIVTVPNPDGLINSILMVLNKISFGLIKDPVDMMFQSDSPFMHLFYFNRQNLKVMLEKAGYKVSKVINQAIINPKKLEKRFEMEGYGLLKILLYANALRLLHYASVALRKKDEIIIIGKKN
jgi:2-polyprenyl-3-methyl-5-hydroxy-6-metoxy-1,4-benzoquinol methylase